VIDVLLSHCLPQQVGGGVWVHAGLRHDVLDSGEVEDEDGSCGGFVCGELFTSSTSAAVGQVGSRLLASLFNSLPRGSAIRAQNVVVEVGRVGKSCVFLRTKAC